MRSTSVTTATTEPLALTAVLPAPVEEVAPEEFDLKALLEIPDGLSDSFPAHAQCRAVLCKRAYQRVPADCWAPSQPVRKWRQSPQTMTSRSHTQSNSGMLSTTLTARGACITQSGGSCVLALAIAPRIRGLISESDACGVNLSQ